MKDDTWLRRDGLWMPPAFADAPEHVCRANVRCGSAFEALIKACKMFNSSDEMEDMIRRTRLAALAAEAPTGCEYFAVAVRAAYTDLDWSRSLVIGGGQN